LRLQLTSAFLLLILLVAAKGAAETPPPGAPEARPADAGSPDAAAPDSTSLTSPEQTEARAAAPRRIAGRLRGELAAYTDSDHVDVVTPSLSLDLANATQGWSAHADYLVDAVSAASVDIVSSASRHWTETRQAGGAQATFKPGDLGVGAAGSFSSEPDYLAWATGGTVTLDLDQKNLTLLAGYGYGHDTIGRSGTPFSVFSRSLTRNAFNGAVTIVMDPATIVVIGGDLILERGDQSKPYRYVPLFTPGVAAGIAPGTSIDDVNRLRLQERPLEQLPLARNRYSAWGRYLHRYAHATLRLEERLYTDTWGLHASSSDARFMIDRGDRWLLASHVRFHAQSPVSFWQRAYTLTDAGIPALRTGDRELGPLWSATGGIGVRWKGGRPRPTGWSIGGDLDVTWTSFLDDLYIGSRLAGIATFVWETDL
jgi:hypothetical protein